MKAKRLAALDIGTNSIRCIVVEADKRLGFKVLDDEKHTVRLGEQLAATGLISAEAGDRAREAVTRLGKLVSSMKVDAVEAIATSAIRRAGNGEEVLASLSQLLGTPIRVISGIEEAELAIVSAQRNFDMSGKRMAVFDIGGGSLEIVTAYDNHIEECYSFDLGAVVMTEQFIHSDPVTAQDLKKLQRHVREHLRKQMADKLPVQTLVGSGGTVNALGYMAMNAQGKSYPSTHGYEVLRSEVVHLLSMLIRKDLKERRLVPGLHADRADIILAGVAVIEEIMVFLGANQLLVNERGIREGLIVRAMEKHGLIQVESTPRNWHDSVWQFATSCHADEKHCTQVARLALAMFDELSVPFALKKGDRRLLEAAALLHDVGYFIAYGSHHKHSYHLIRHAELFDFTPREQEVIAQVARYHRKSLPKRKHEAFQALGDSDRQRVERLGGILRLADGLDRSRSATISDISCRFKGTHFMIQVAGDADLSVEIFGGAAKRDLFEKAFGMEVVLETAP